ncbi:MAG: hypothetical protein RB191_02705 [Terriglobia bacterium]|nr:hypothetical protein [Terriglobia bacterium]
MLFRKRFGCGSDHRDTLRQAKFQSIPTMQTVANFARGAAGDNPRNISFLHIDLSNLSAQMKRQLPGFRRFQFIGKVAAELALLVSVWVIFNEADDDGGAEAREWERGFEGQDLNAA